MGVGIDDRHRQLGRHRARPGDCSAPNQTFAPRPAKAGKPSRQLGIFPMTRPGGVRILGRMRKLRVAVDIGGTFTDLVAYDEETREVVAVKAPSTPPDFIQGVLDALQKAG